MLKTVIDVPARPRLAYEFGSSTPPLLAPDHLAVSVSGQDRFTGPFRSP